MKTYEETRRIIREAIKDYSNNTYAVARIMIDVLTHDVTCTQFDTFFEMLIDRVLSYHNHKTYEDIIIKLSNLTDRPLTISTNSDEEDEETIYNKNLHIITTAISDVTDYVYGKNYIVKEHAVLVSDLANAIYSEIPNMLAIDLAKELLALSDDCIDVNDISDILSTLTLNHDWIEPVGVAIRDFIANTPTNDMMATIKYLVRTIACHLDLGSFAIFYTAIQRELMRRLNKEGENTDVF